MLDASLSAQLKTSLERVVRPVEIVASLDESEASQRMRSLLDQIVSLSPQLSLVTRRDDGERTPSFSLAVVASCHE